MKTSLSPFPRFSSLLPFVPLSLPLFPFNQTRSASVHSRERSRSSETGLLQTPQSLVPAWGRGETPARLWSSSASCRAGAEGHQAALSGEVVLALSVGGTYIAVDALLDSKFQYQDIKGLIQDTHHHGL